MKAFIYFFIGLIIGALGCAVLIFFTVGHYREPQHNRNMGYLDAQYDIVTELEMHFGANGVFPGSNIQQVEPDPEHTLIFQLKSTTVLAAEKDGVPTLYICP